MPGKTGLSHVCVSISGLWKAEFVLVEKVWYYSWIPGYYSFGLHACPDCSDLLMTLDQGLSFG